jgi:hypothetical protein
MAAVPATVTTAALQCTIHRDMAKESFSMRNCGMCIVYCLRFPSREGISGSLKAATSALYQRVLVRPTWDRTQQQ